MPTNVDKSVEKSENLSGIKELSMEEAEQMSKLSRDICRVMAGYSSRVAGGAAVMVVGALVRHVFPDKRVRTMAILDWLQHLVIDADVDLEVGVLVEDESPREGLH